VHWEVMGSRQLLHISSCQAYSLSFAVFISLSHSYGWVYRRQ